MWENKQTSTKQLNLKLINSSIDCVFGSQVFYKQKRVGLSLWLKFCQVQHYHRMDQQCKTLSLAYLSLKMGCCCKTLQIALSPTSYFYPSLFFNLFLIRSSLLSKRGGRNRLSLRFRNQFVSAHQVLLWKWQSWGNTWNSQNEIMADNKFCREVLSVSVMFRRISAR